MLQWRWGHMVWSLQRGKVRQFKWQIVPENSFWLVPICSCNPHLVSVVITEKMKSIFDFFVFYLLLRYNSLSHQFSHQLPIHIICKSRDSHTQPTFYGRHPHLHGHTVENNVSITMKIMLSIGMTIMNQLQWQGVKWNESVFKILLLLILISFMS